MCEGKNVELLNASAQSLLNIHGYLHICATCMNNTDVGSVASSGNFTKYLSLLNMTRF